MRLFKDNYVIDGTPLEIQEFLSVGRDKKSKDTYKGDYVLTEDTLVFYASIGSTGSNITFYNGFTELPKRGYTASEGTILRYVRHGYQDNVEHDPRVKTLLPIFENKQGTEVIVPLSYINEGKLKSYENTNNNI